MGSKYLEYAIYAPKPVREEVADLSDIYLNEGYDDRSFQVYDTTSVKNFVREAFSGAHLLEEHQV